MSEHEGADLDTGAESPEGFEAWPDMPPRLPLFDPPEVPWLAERDPAPLGHVPGLPGTPLAPVRDEAPPEVQIEDSPEGPTPDPEPPALPLEDHVPGLPGTPVVAHAPAPPGVPVDFGPGLLDVLRALPQSPDEEDRYTSIEPPAQLDQRGGPAPSEAALPLEDHVPGLPGTPVTTHAPAPPESLPVEAPSVASGPAPLPLEDHVPGLPGTPITTHAPLTDFVLEDAGDAPQGVGESFDAPAPEADNMNVGADHVPGLPGTPLVSPVEEEAAPSDDDSGDDEPKAIHREFSPGDHVWVDTPKGVYAMEVDQAYPNFEAACKAYSGPYGMTGILIGHETSPIQPYYIGRCPDTEQPVATAHSNARPIEEA